MFGRIALNEYTKSHKMKLEALGYLVEVVNDCYLKVHIQGFVTEVDVRNGPHELRALIDNKKALGYKSRIRTGVSKYVTGRYMLKYLGQLSCLVMSDTDIVIKEGGLKVSDVFGK